MSQPAQVKFTTPNNDWCAIDNAAAPTFPSPNAGALQGYDTMTGAVAQGLNSFGDTGTVLLDAVNDAASVNFRDATVNGNPVSAAAFTYKTLTKVLQDSRQGINILFKSPA